MDNVHPSPLIIISQKCEEVKFAIYSTVGVSIAFDEEERTELSEADLKIHQLKALWDTGAAMTCISERMAKKINLELRRYEDIGTASGIMRDVPVYVAHLIFPNKVLFQEWEVVEFISSGKNDADLIIGMDIIMQGDFALTNFGGRSLFSFRLPSMQSIDFEAQHLLAE